MRHDMSGIETLLASAYTALTTAGTAAAGTAAAGTTAAATAGMTAAEVAALAGGTAEALSGAGVASGFAAPAAAGLTTAELISAGSSLAGAGSQLLSEAPKIDLPKAPTRDDARTAADRQNFMLKRRGRAATLLTSPQGVASSPTLGSPSLTGSG
jgi:hypothetical protein